MTAPKSRLFQLSCAARSVFTFFALIVSFSFLRERKVGRATCGPTLVRGRLFQAALAGAILCAVELSTLKVRITGSASSTTVLQKGRSTKRTTRELPEQNPCDSLSKCSDGPRVMPLHAHRPNPEGGIWAAFRGRVSPPDRRERRGKNGSARRLGTHRPRYRG